MSDDEEVIMKGSQLHNYMKTNDIVNLHANFVDRELRLGHCAEVIKEDSNVNEQCGGIKVSSLYRKFKFSEYSGNVIYMIVRTGLLYPDHIAELDNNLELQNVKEGKLSKTSATVYSSGLIASSYLFVFLNKNFKVLQYVGLAAAAVYFGYKICTNIRVCYEKSKIKCFMTAIENLFSVTKKTISFILESEFLLRSKIIKDQPFYVSSNGWVNPSTKEGAKYSGLIVPELRRILLAVYLDVIIIFDNFFKFMKEVLLLKSDVDNDMYVMEPLHEFYDLQKQNRIPSSEDLKKVNNMYLVIQSECLKRLIFCFVEGLWVYKSSYRNLNVIVIELTRYISRFTTYATELELQYQKCINELKNNSERIRGRAMLKTGNTKDKHYTFINSFLTKADAHMLSLLLDLKMINNWVNEFEENNKDNDSDCSNQLITTLHDRLQLMKGNIQCFINLYNDNCNILKSMTHSTTVNTPVNDLNTVDDKSSCTTLTGIEVGKSEFDVSGRDEVLISLSNDDVNKVHSTCDIDYEDQIVQKCLPRNVLDELKFALKGKKEEWIEREKKATLNSDVTIANLDLDNLMNSSENDYKNAELSNGLAWYQNAGKSISYDSSKYSSDEDDGSFDQFKIVTGASCSKEVEIRCHKTKYISSIKFNDNLNNCKLKKNPMFDANNTDSEETFDCNSSSTPKTFVNQLKLAQKSFNLNMTEEEFREDSSSEDEIC